MNRPALSIPALSIVVPCYNEAACLDVLHARISGAAKVAVGDDYEIVLINDGSRDDSWGVMQRLAAADPRLVAINLSRNHGHQLALTAGLDLCAGEQILIIDADLQDPPELLSDMRAAMAASHADVVYAVRRQRAGETVFKKATAAAFYRMLTRMTDTPIPLDTGDFRLMSRRALDAFLSLPEQARFIRGMVAWIGFRQVPFPYDRAERLAGETNYPLAKMIRLANRSGAVEKPDRAAAVRQPCGARADRRFVAAVRVYRDRLAVGQRGAGLDLDDARHGVPGRGADVRAGDDRRVSRAVVRRVEAAAAVYRRGCGRADPG
jgi:glycosyltransferase involved in cell wall biosynthesis